jgi:SAM-dependent methyltransferase
VHSAAILPWAVRIGARRGIGARQKGAQTASVGASAHGPLARRPDLKQLQLPENTFELILCVQYLQRSLFAELERALRPGGFLLFETFTRAQLEFDGGPRNPEYLLDSGELRTAFPELRVIFHRELRAGQGIASLLAQKPKKRN